MGAIVSSRHRAQKKIQQRNAREAKAIAIAGRKAADQAKIEQLKAKRDAMKAAMAQMHEASPQPPPSPPFPPEFTFWTSHPDGDRRWRRY